MPGRPLLKSTKRNIEYPVDILYLDMVSALRRRALHSSLQNKTFIVFPTETSRNFVSVHKSSFYFTNLYGDILYHLIDC